MSISVWRVIYDIIGNDSLSVSRRRNEEVGCCCHLSWQKIRATRILILTRTKIFEWKINRWSIRDDVLVLQVVRYRAEEARAFPSDGEALRWHAGVFKFKYGILDAERRVTYTARIIIPVFVDTFSSRLVYPIRQRSPGNSRRETRYARGWNPCRNRKRNENSSLPAHSLALHSDVTVHPFD